MSILQLKSLRAFRVSLGLRSTLASLSSTTAQLFAKFSKVNCRRRACVEQPIPKPRWMHKSSARRIKKPRVVAGHRGKAIVSPPHFPSPQASAGRDKSVRLPTHGAVPSAPDPKIRNQKLKPESIPALRLPFCARRQLTASGTCLIEVIPPHTMSVTGDERIRIDASPPLIVTPTRRGRTGRRRS